MLFLHSNFSRSEQRDRGLKDIYKKMKWNKLFNKEIILIAIGVKGNIAIIRKTTTKIQSIVLHISIIEYILFSIKLILFLKK